MYAEADYVRIADSPAEEFLFKSLVSSYGTLYLTSELEKKPIQFCFLGIRGKKTFRRYDMLGWFVGGCSRVT
jgi:hypothetical protein